MEGRIETGGLGNPDTMKLQQTEFANAVCTPIFNLLLKMSQVATPLQAISYHHVARIGKENS